MIKLPKLRSNRPNLKSLISLSCESLEERMMLSTVQVIAAGTTGAEELTLEVDGANVQTWDNLGSGAYSGNFVTNSFTTSETVTADDIILSFQNDLYIPNQVDRNVRVDAIVIDGVRFETEAPEVYSTGTWLPEDGVVPGNRESEYIHSNGFISYSSSTSPTTDITVNARGNEGTESFALQIDGVTVQTWNNINTSFTSHFYTADGDVTADRVRVVFLNDLFDSAAGIDRNLIVDDIVVGNEQFETEASSVFSTGTWTAADGIVPGFRQGETLHSNGYFAYEQTPTANPGTISLSIENLSIDEDNGVLNFVVFRTGGTSGSVSVNYQTFAETAGAGDFQPMSGTLFFDDGVTDRFVSVNIIDDLLTEGAETFRFVISNPTGGASLGGITTQNVTIRANDQDIGVGQAINVTSTGINLNEDAGQAVVTIQRTGGTAGAVTVGYRTVAGSASTADFTPRSGTITFNSGQATRTVSIPIINDTATEPLESFRFEIFNPSSGAVIGANDFASITIVDDDNTTQDFLPDLTPIASTLREQLRIDTNEQPGRQLMRFSTELANAGTGPLEIWGGSTSGDSQQVFQRIYQEGGGSRDVLAGEFVYHPSHGHVHFEAFATYGLTLQNAAGTVVASGGKTSFCLINIRNPFPSVTASADLVHGRGGNSCGQIQGISAGYSDVYSSSLDGQWIDITGVANGTYWLEIEADPDNNIRESNESNNTTRIQVAINNGTVTSV